MLAALIAYHGWYFDSIDLKYEESAEYLESLMLNGLEKFNDQSLERFDGYGTRNDEPSMDEEDDADFGTDLIYLFEQNLKIYFTQIR